MSTSSFKRARALNAAMCEARHVIEAEWQRLVATESDVRPHEPVQRGSGPSIDAFQCSARFSDGQYGVVSIDAMAAAEMSASELRKAVCREFGEMVWEWVRDPVEQP